MSVECKSKVLSLWPQAMRLLPVLAEWRQRRTKTSGSKFLHDDAALRTSERTERFILP